MSHRKALILAAAACVAVGFAACDSGTSEEGDGTVTIDPQGDIPGVDNPGDLSTTPGLRRLSVDQLDATVQVVAGKDLQGNNIYWRIGSNNACITPAIKINLTGLGIAT